MRLYFSVALVACVLFFPSATRAAEGNEPEKDLASAQGALRRRDYVRAIFVFTEMLRYSPDNVDAYAGRVKAYEARKDFKAAAADYTELLRLQPEATQYLVARAEAYLILAQFDAAIADYTAALARWKDRSDLYFARGELYRIQHKLPEAAQDLSNSLRLAPHALDVLLARAKVFEALHGYAEALDDLNEAELVSSSSMDVHFLLSDVYQERGDYAKALDEAVTAQRLAPANAVAYNLVAWWLSICPDQHLRDGQKAVEFATKACELSHWKSPGFVDTLASAYAEAGEFALAIKWEAQCLGDLAKPDQEEARKRLELFRRHQPYIAPAPDAKMVEWDNLRYQTFDLVWRTVDQEYFDPKMGGVDWSAIREKYRVRVPTLGNEDQLRPFLQEMLNELHKTHFAIVPRSAAIFSPEERNREGTVGAKIDVANGKVVVTKVEPKSPAAAAGLRAGDTILSLNGTHLDTIAESLATAGESPTHAGLYLKGAVEARFSGPVGTRIQLSVTGIDGQKRDLALTGVAFDGIWSEPVGNFPSMPIEIETRRDSEGIGYLRFNAFALPMVKPAKNFLRSLQTGDGLILDLRGNPGGTIAIAPGLCGWLSDREMTMGFVDLREGEVTLDIYPQDRAFLGPIAILIDGSSASTSEVLASGLSDAKRARLFGETTAGAALPSLYKQLPTGDLFQYAMGDIRRLNGKLLEGAGVQPDEKIDCTREDFAAGRDPVYDAAKTWLLVERKKPVVLWGAIKP